MLAEMFSADDERSNATPLFAARGAQAREAVTDPVGTVTLPTANLARSVNFYARAFGFRLLVGTGGRRPRRVVLHAARTRLALEEHGLEQRAARTRERARLHLQDFDAARERVWDLGIATTEDTASHDDAAAAGGRRRFVVRDPDGHEIEVVDRRAQ